MYVWENSKNISKGKTKITKFDYIFMLNEQRKILWDQVDVGGRETNTNKLQLIEALIKGNLIYNMICK